MKKGPIFTRPLGKVLIFSSLPGQVKGPTGANVPPVSTLKNALMLCNNFLQETSLAI